MCAIDVMLVLVTLVRMADGCGSAYCRHIAMFLALTVADNAIRVYMAIF